MRQNPDLLQNNVNLDTRGLLSGITLTGGAISTVHPNRLRVRGADRQESQGQRDLEDPRSEQRSGKRHGEEWPRTSQNGKKDATRPGGVDELIEFFLGLASAFRLPA